MSDGAVNGYAVAADGAYIAYQTLGEGPVDIVWQFDGFSNVDLIWEFADDRRWLGGLASFSRLILHDRRGTGASSRNVPAPDLETRVGDLLAVLDAVGVDQPVVLGGQFEAGGPNALLAATQPDRVRSLVWISPTARSTWTPDYPWGVRPEYVEAEAKATATWGTAEYGRAFMVEQLDDGLLLGDPSLAGQDRGGARE